MKKKIALIQMNVKMSMINENFTHAKKLMQKALLDNPDIIVFPETLNTGFFPNQNLTELCDKNGAKTKEIFGNFALKNNVNIIAGSICDLRCDKIYNTSYVFNRNGEVAASYDKVHNFSPQKEDKFFSSGNKAVNFVLDGLKCSVIICYDLRFVEFIRSICLKNIDILFVLAHWPLKRINHWIILNKARAIENQIYVCAVNGCGLNEELRYGGNSLLIDPLGEEILHFDKNEDIKSAWIDTEILQKIRKSINVFNDRRPDIYKF